MDSILAVLGRRLALGAMLLGAIALGPVAAGAQGAATTAGSATPSVGVRPAVDGAEDQAATRVANAVCDKRVVLLGELPEHGEARGMNIKARIVQRLVGHCGFHTVLVEAGSYDFFGLEQRIAATPRPRADSLDLMLARAIGGLWWTQELADWRQWLLGEALAGRVTIGGIDDQPSATAVYARATLPALVGAAVPPARSAECRDAVARYLNWGYTDAVPYDAAERDRLADCTALAAQGAPTTDTAERAERTSKDEVMLDDIASYFARERTAAAGSGAGTPDRDLVMDRHLAWWSARLPRDAKIVVWTATTHATRVPALHSPGTTPLGARLTERWGDRLAIVGFTALQGQWSLAGRPAQTLAPLPADALEARALPANVDWAYLDRAALHSLGTVASRLLGRITTLDWSTAFDGVVVLHDEIVPTFEPRR